MAATIQSSQSVSIADSPHTRLQTSPMDSGGKDHNEFYTIDSLLRLRANGSKAKHPIVAYPSTGTEYAFYSPSQLNVFVENAAIHYAKVIPQRRSSAEPVRVVGLLGPSSLEYLITLLAVSRLGHTVLLLSTRIVEDAYVSLLEATKTNFLVASSAFQAVGNRAGKRTGTALIPVLTREEFDKADVGALPTYTFDQQTETRNVCWIIHSSGSTGHPKPIYQTHAGALKNYANNFGLRGFITLPLFHAHGISCLFRAIHSEKLIYMYNANLPLTAPYLLSTLREHRDIEVLYAVPYALKLLSESDEGLSVLTRLELVMFGGSACPKPIGDALVQNGVRLVSHYGTTETGQLMTSFRERSDLDWDYVRPGDSLLPFLRWEEQMTGIYELVVLEGWPSKVASNRPDNSYATKDLFEKHPTKPNAWRYYARLDDTLVLENGEKANPLVIEGVARNNPNVDEAIAFGANKSRLGLFLIRSVNGKDYSDAEIVHSVFPAIEKLNAELPAYAHISHDMIHVLPADVVFRKTDKGTVIRSAFYRDFQKQIDRIYENEEASGEQVLEGNELIDFLRKELLELVPSIEPNSLSRTTDVFSLGVDSLQSIRLRTTILETLDLRGQKPSQNFVFENPSLQAMAEELTRLRLGRGPKEDLPVEGRMQKLIEKYTQDFKVFVPTQRVESGEHIVITGATGSLGAHIVSQLAKLDQVSTIYCLVRASSVDLARRRVDDSLRARGILGDISPSAERKIVALPADLSNTTCLGLEEGIYHQITKNITAVVHCAWSVNFNWSLESFEKSCILATRNLLDLCLSAQSPYPARFSFCSSVSTVARTPGNWVPETLPESLTYAQDMGYAQSKLVTENIVHRAAHHTGMTARVLRLGQIVADTVHGIWNAQEAIPMILQTAQTTKALPRLDDVLSWTPVDVMASSVIDLTLSDGKNEKTTAGIMNVTNKTLNHWTHNLLPLLKQAGLEFEDVPTHEWLDRFKHSNPDPELNPPIKLLEFFVGKYGHNRIGSVLLYDTKRAIAASPSLAKADGLTLDFVCRFVAYFRGECWTGSIS
ncbi:hypothetical protein UA08_05740 [Talaromyces atroroseus]|uniref:Carrier domain-containing protein n=1 Tax=Talaromyces atroroseus TaxID=1441469 RepID=A0A225AZ68_TALAT|nr:hypothetical protein UA08_05740 [Talaromyces atroroseus]OKL58807.1 hypothetical protein UA08_05740 [Talaromyces atroroseus]